MPGAGGRDEPDLREMTSFTSEAVRFSCAGDHLIGILTRPANPGPRGVLIVVGGPQYRVGSHRQFLLLARHLAACGIASFRFDYRGMGDSEGDGRTFEAVDDDLRAACDAFLDRLPLREVVVWGLCDAASAALFYAYRDRRVGGIVLLNPWVRTVEGEARTYLKHYYLKRIVSPDFWRKVGRLRFDYRESLKALAGTVTNAFAPPPADEAARCGGPLPERMADGLARFPGRALLILSGSDLTADEFREAAKQSPRWQELLASPRIARRELPPADHTFSRREWRDQVAAWTAEWVRSW